MAGNLTKESLLCFGKQRAKETIARNMDIQHITNYCDN